MRDDKIIQVAINSPLRRVFDYSAPKKHQTHDIQVGMRVQVPFGNKSVIGIVVAITDKTDVPAQKLKAISDVLDTAPLLPSHLYKLVCWSAKYYQYPLGDVLAQAIPALLRQGKEKNTLDALEKKKLTPHQTHGLIIPGPLLNAAQKNAVQNVTKQISKFHVFLLHGVTGSGKTEVYLQILKSMLANGQQALILVPEIGLTPQLLTRFQERLGLPIGVVHSGLTDKERLLTWLWAKNNELKIIIGTRSAIFTPFANLAIIIVDEEHDLSLKQQDGFKYHARDLAVRRAQLENIPIVLGSATPSLESLHNVERERYQLLELPERAGEAVHPLFKLIDLRRQKIKNGIATTVLPVIAEHLKQGNQVLIFLNRRGFAPVLMCHECAWVLNCSRCEIPMTLHQKPYQAQCHHCEKTQAIPKKCAQCSSTQLINIGAGTERVEEFLNKEFPHIKIARIDRDSTRRKGELEAKLATVQDGTAQLLVGTQMIAKGHHFPNVTLVVVLDADGGLYSADFHASERMAQLLLQVSGRAGRAEKPGEVLIQTHHPEHPLLNCLITQGYMEFVRQALAQRNKANLPPYHYFALLRAEAVTGSVCSEFLQAAKQILKTANNTVQLMGPAQAPVEKRQGRYRWQLLLATKNRSHLQQLLHHTLPLIEQLKEARKIRWSIDVDPLEML
ncbi:MAG: primosomal protein N' [Gammaproteobacteria bacterium]|nr:primosomal protein N' [Gammaproteobacteria bacterium]